MSRLTQSNRLLLLIFSLFFFGLLSAEESWEKILEEASGQTVYFNAWGGATSINTYIEWAGKRIKKEYGVTLQHVKIGDANEYISRILSDKNAGKLKNGGIDLVWTNGENFKTLKENGLLYGPFSEKLPNYRYADTENKATLISDFTIPVEGYESPWGAAQIVFMYDTAITKVPPKSMVSLLSYAKKKPGRITYPQPPDFTGTTFLKQALYELTSQPSALEKPATAENFVKTTEGLWKWLDEIEPYLWRKGKNYPKNGEEQRQLLNDGEIDISLTFSPGGATSAIINGDLPETVRTYVLETGTIGNVHFVAIPFNANSVAGAKVVANFFLSPEAQLEKQKPDNWGDFTVLSVEKLPSEYQIKFRNLDLGMATLTPEELGSPLPEPHPSWMSQIEKEWIKRYRQ